MTDAAYLNCSTVVNKYVCWQHVKDNTAGMGIGDRDHGNTAVMGMMNGHNILRSVMWCIVYFELACDLHSVSCHNAAGP